MQLSTISSIPRTYLRTTKTNHLLIAIVSSETFSRLINRQHLVVLQPQYITRTFQICIYFPLLYTDPCFLFKVRRNETICCLVGFGIGVGCCILYRIISNLLTPSINTKSSVISKRVAKREVLTNLEHEYDNYNRNNAISDEMTWSEMTSSLSTVHLSQDSYHSNSLTGDSGVDCPENPIGKHPHSDDEHEIFFKKYDTQTGNESHISTEKGLERALEQTSRFYTDLEHIASDLGTLTKRYSQSHHSIDALDWDWHEDEVQSPKTTHRKQIRSNNKNKLRRRLNPSNNQIEYNESDNDNRVLDYSTSPLRRRHSSVYFNSTDSTSDEENLEDDTLH